MKILKQLITLALLPLALYAQDTTHKGSIITSDGYPIALSREDGLRLFPYKDSLEPLLGYVNTHAKGKIGLSKSVNAQLNIGKDIYISINLDLQMRVEEILDRYKQTLDAQEVLVMVMQSDAGQMVVMASSNRYNPNAIKQEDVPSIVPKYARYPYEPGSLMKPLTLAIALDKQKVEPNTAFDLNDGNLNIGNNLILTDSEIHQYLSAEGIILKDSHIGISLISWLLTATEFRNGLDRFGLMDATGIELSYDKKGFVKSSEKLKDKTAQAGTALGYGLLTTPLQLLKAYNVFNNKGILIVPTFLTHTPSKQTHVISNNTSEQIHKILVENVRSGTGQNAQYDGLEVGGKTAMAYIFKNGKYRDEFHSSFYGFVNDTQGHKYSIGVVTIRPKAKHMQKASVTAVPVFREVVDAMAREKYLKKGLDYRFR